ncbi:MAG: GNAT family N-acetyltransferase [Candidatus Eremiobacteraeota bacterium]|nr:GNAT family N-acetyltransferase [Candidatus Eremiobacteraeota bacterium]
MWSFLQKTAGEGFLAAREDGRLLGYALFVPSLRAVQRRAFLSGTAFRWALRALTGQYDMQLRGLLRTFQNKVFFLFQGQRYRTRGDAQLLNVAVDPDAQGRGIAKQLLDAGMKAMRALQIPEVRLEVRPWNTAAVALYRNTGWREVGRTRDLEGEWIVMVANP